jgi:phenylalanyl-tRNA synthetase alpha chain
VDEILQKIMERLQALRDCEDSETLEQLRIEILGRKGYFAQIGPFMGKLSPEDRPIYGKKINDLKNDAQQLFDSKKLAFEKGARKSSFDLTLPGRAHEIGKLHPLSIVQRRMLDIFVFMGFEVVTGPVLAPEIEEDYYNFECLNLHKDHPARDTQDSFYLDDDYHMLLRTQTSPVQIRYMQQAELPVKIIAPGRCFRRDMVTARHSPMFHQIEGLLVDEGINFTHLKGVLETFARELFGHERQVRFRPDYFPFTEPSAEIAIDCTVCGGKGCRTCSNTGWIEILGCGMVHPKVIRNGGFDPEKVSGFAFGIGIDRTAMLLYSIDDIRLFTENDKRFLDQF